MGDSQVGGKSVLACVLHKQHTILELRWYKTGFQSYCVGPNITLQKSLYLIRPMKQENDDQQWMSVFVHFFGQLIFYMGWR